MDTTPAQVTPPLLDDDAMREAERRIRERVDAIAVLKLVRNTYEDNRQRLIAELAESQRYALQLERALGEAWQPIEDEWVEAENAYDFYVWPNKITMHDSNTGYEADWVLPDDIRLCRRTSSSPTAGE